jgi:putative membrane protein insertion efficiency factor
MSPLWGASVRPDSADKPSLAVRAALGVLRGYKVLLSPLFTGACRFHPSCSNYMAEAIRVHGVVRGGWLGLVRLSRCHPWGSSGHDPVPARRN